MKKYIIFLFPITFPRTFCEVRTYENGKDIRYQDEFGKSNEKSEVKATNLYLTRDKLKIKKYVQRILYTADRYVINVINCVN